MNFVPILRKDLRHLWPQALVLWPLLYFAARQTDTYNGYGALSYIVQLLPIAAGLACWNLVIALIHQERLVGDTAYWLTRPIPRPALALAKAVSILLLINLPLLVAQAAVFLQNGLSPIRFFSYLLWKQLFFTAFVILPAVALACITRSLPQAVFVGLGSAVIAIALLGSMTSFRMYYGFGWAETTFTPLVLLAGGIAIAAVQYTSRHTNRARVIFACTVLLAFLGARLFPRSAVAAILHSLSPRHLNASQLAVTYDPGRKSPLAGLHIPVRVSDFPNCGVLFASGHGELRRSGKPVAPITVRQLYGLIDGQGWLQFNVPASAYAYADDDLDLQATLELAWFAHTETVPPDNLAALDAALPGACRVTQGLNAQGILCASPFARASFMLLQQNVVTRRRPTATGWEPSREVYDRDNLLTGYNPAPIPYSPWLQAVEKFESQPSAGVTTRAVVVREPAAFVSRPFAIHGLRLSSFAE